MTPCKFLIPVLADGFSQKLIYIKDVISYAILFLLTGVL